MSKRKIGRPQRSSAGIEATYRKKLDTLVTAMNRSLAYWLCARWKSNPPIMAADESPSKGLARSMKELRRRWTDRFSDAAKEISEWFARSIMRHSTAAMEQTLEAGGIPTVKFKMTAGVRDAYNAIVAENVALIKSIPAQHLTAVEGMVMRSVSLGRDLGTLAKGLEHQFGVTKRRAAFIAIDQNAKGTAVITRARQLESNVTTAIWVHSHAGKKPRAEHLAFDGKTYDVAKGAYLEGVWTWPGCQPRCRCFSRPVLEGF